MDDLYFRIPSQNETSIVHFSHFTAMSRSVEYPDDLLHAISHHQVQTRSCRVLWPGHNIYSPCGPARKLVLPTRRMPSCVEFDTSNSAVEVPKKLENGCIENKRLNDISFIHFGRHRSLNLASSL